MKKVTLLSALCLMTLMSAQMFAQTFRYTGAPNLPILRGQTAIHRIQVTDNVDIADVRIAVYAKTVMYSSLRVELVSPSFFLRKEPRSYSRQRKELAQYGMEPSVTRIHTVCSVTEVTTSRRRQRRTTTSFSPQISSHCSVAKMARAGGH